MPVSELISKIRYELLPLKLWTLSRLAKSKRNHPVNARAVSIVCFYTVASWSGRELGPGTAGAEEAVVNVAKELVALGWEVTVYCNCGLDGGTSIDGVLYLPEYRYSPTVIQVATIFWRDPRIARFPTASKLNFLWLHNVPPRDSLGPLDLEAVDAAIVLSEFHRRSLASIPDTKIWISSNGLPTCSIIKDVERNPFKCIYASAPDRGLECLLHLWPKIRRHVPNAELVVYYGWETWEIFHARSAWANAWRKRIELLLKQPGIAGDYVHIDGNELLREFASASVWLYPTEATEVSCINAMSAQIAGAFPITTNVGALPETVHGGRIVSSASIYSDPVAQAEFVEAAVETLLHPSEDARASMIARAEERFSWRRVAANWSDRLLASESPVAR